MSANEPIAPVTQRRCPHCGNPVAQRADSCLTCGAHLKELPRRGRRLARPDLTWPVLILLAAVVLLLWQPWRTAAPLAEEANTTTPTASLTPTVHYAQLPTATPLSSPTPSPSPTLPPNQTLHTVKSGETVITIAKLYGTTKQAVLKANNLKDNSPIRPGDQLIIPLAVADTPTPTPTQPPTPTPQTYVVTQSDTLSQIARRYGTTVEALMQVNGIADATGLRVGATLIIPQVVAAPTSAPYIIHEVQSGNTLSGIATKYKVTVDAIKRANNLTGDRISVGQKLKIPTGPLPPTPTATPTPTQTVTPSPTPPYPAPAALSPPNEAGFEGPEASILLSWTSVGILGPEEWYVLRMRRSGSVAELLPPVWTRVTSWRLPAELFVADLPDGQTFFWSIAVMRQTGTAEDGTRLGVEISPRSVARSFTWK